MAVPWPVTVLVTAVIALLCAMFITTQFVYTTEKILVHTTTENAFKFLSDPLFIKDIHPLAVDMKINSRQPIEGGEFFDVTVTNNFPVFGHTPFQNQIWTNRETLTVKNMCFPLWILMTTNVTWWVESSGEPESCYIQGRTSTRVPWVISSQVEALESEAHGNLLRQAGEKINRLSRNPGKKP